MHECKKRNNKEQKTAGRDAGYYITVAGTAAKLQKQNSGHTRTRTYNTYSQGDDMSQLSIFEKPDAKYI